MKKLQINIFMMGCLIGLENNAMEPHKETPVCAPLNSGNKRNKRPKNKNKRPKNQKRKEARRNRPSLTAQLQPESPFSTASLVADMQLLTQKFNASYADEAKDKNTSVFLPRVVEQKETHIPAYTPTQEELASLLSYTYPSLEGKYEQLIQEQSKSREGIVAKRAADDMISDIWAHYYIEGGKNNENLSSALSAFLLQPDAHEKVSACIKNKKIMASK